MVCKKGTTNTRVQPILLQIRYSDIKEKVRDHLFKFFLSLPVHMTPKILPYKQKKTHTKFLLWCYYLLLSGVLNIQKVPVEFFSQTQIIQDRHKFNLCQASHSKFNEQNCTFSLLAIVLIKLMNEPSDKTLSCSEH
jgi:hypothetical protein